MFLKCPLGPSRQRERRTLSRGGGGGGGGVGVGVGGDLKIKVPCQYRDSHHKVRKSHDVLIFIMGMPICGKIVFLLRRPGYKEAESYSWRHSGSRLVPSVMITSSIAQDIAYTTARTTLEHRANLVFFNTPHILHFTLREKLGGICVGVIYQWVSARKTKLHC